MNLSPPSFRPIVAHVALVLLAAFLSACAGASSSADAGTGATTHLERLANSGARDSSAVRAPLAPGLDPAAFAAIDPADDNAHLTLDEAISRIIAQADANADADAAAPDEAAEPTPESLLLYISGRSRRLGGDLEGALGELEAAVKSDPASPELWREIGETHRQLGDRLSAAAAYRNALRYDPDDLPSLAQLGLWSLDRHDSAAGARSLARARDVLLADDADDADDPALPFIVSANLGRSLLELGYLRAGITAIKAGIQMSENFDSPTVYRAELEQIFRLRGESWRDIGDVLIRLKEFESATEAYRAAAELPTLNPAALLPRLVYASMKTGRAAFAAQTILQALDAGSDLSGDRLLPLIRYIGQNTALGDDLRDAIDQRRHALDTSEQARLQSLYARAAAAALQPRQSIEALRDWLATHPTDDGAVRDLFALVDDDPASMIVETIHLIEQAPINEGRYIQALVERAPSLDAVLDAMPPSTTIESGLIRARVLQRTDRIPEAIDSLEPLVAKRDPNGVATALLVALLAESGQIERAEQALDGLRHAADPAHRLLFARALATLGKHQEALDVLLPMLEAPPGSPAPFPTAPGTDPAIAESQSGALDATLLALDLSWRVGDADAAERLARRAIEISPAAEPAYARLIDLYNRGGPLADNDKLSAVVRDIRQADPSSRTLRWLRAQELIRARQYDQAERDLLSLAEDEPTQSVIDLLTALWARTGATDKAEAWLRAQRASNPMNGAPVRSLATLLADVNRATEAVALLEDWLSHHPEDDAAARSLESILRDKLQRLVEADDRALARLERHPHTLSRAVELTDILIRRGKTDEAANELHRTFEATRTMTPAMARATLRAVFLISQEAIRDQAPVESALSLNELAFERFPQEPVEMRDQHLALLAKSEAPFERSIEVLDAAVSAFPDRATELATVAVGRLITLEQPERALRIAEHVAPLLSAPDGRFLGTWLQATWNLLDGDAGRLVIQAIRTAGRTSDVLSLLSGQPAQEGDPGAAQLAMVSADLLASRNAAFDDVVTLYELALSYDPNHQTANNNFGYYLAEQGVRLEEAERFILRSLEIRPNEPFALDSYGWVRYKQGVIADERDDAGQVSREGAVSILQRASVVGINRTSPEVQDHLGDALWALGDHDRALARWRAAVALLEEAVGATPDSADSVAERDRILAKVRAAEAGQPPAIAPIIGTVNVPPVRAADSGATADPNGPPDLK